MERYSRNMLALSKDENESLREKRVCVIGCGGLGGYIIEMLGRLGVGTIVAVDGDVFEESNLNRQLLSDMTNLGKSKAFEAQNRMKKINPDIKIIPISENFTEDNYKSILSGCHVAIDALDNIKSRLLLQECCEKLSIPLVHGAIGGWYGQITTILPGDGTLDIIYKGFKDEEIKKTMGNPPFIPALAASLEVSEVVKILINRGTLLRKKMLFINLLDNSFDLIEF
jgi:molybdopterin/thiamine biosynthesis adenylyltransferase